MLNLIFLRIFVLQIINTSVSMQEKIIILDFGSQTTQLIGRRVRELNVYCEIVPYNKFPQGDESVKGVILSGSPFSVNTLYWEFATVHSSSLIPMVERLSLRVVVNTDVHI